MSIPDAIAPAPATVDFWFDFSCPYAYLASTQIEALAQRTGANLRPRPFLLGGVFRALGGPQNMADTLGPAKAEHNLADMQRWATHWDVPLTMPAGHPMRTVEALRAVLVVEADGGDVWPLIHALYRAYWVDGSDLATLSGVAGVLSSVGLDADRTLARTQAPEIKERLRLQTVEAVTLGIFGAPSFVLHSEGSPGTLYWGQDRLGAVEQALGGRPVGDLVDGSADALCIAGRPAAPIDFYYDYSSPYACLAAIQAEERLGAAATWKPMLLGAVFHEIGQVMVPLERLNASKRAYVGVELKRRAAALDFPLSWPSRFPMRTLLPLRVTLLVGPDTPAGRRLAVRIFRAYWAEDQDIAAPEVVAALCDEVGLDGADLVTRAAGPEAKAALRDATASAIAAGVFGAPTFIVHPGHTGSAPELFWGSDRLGLAAKRALGHR